MRKTGAPLSLTMRGARSLGEAAVAASLSAVAFGVGCLVDQVVYERLLVPRLPQFDSVPLPLWALVVAPGGIGYLGRNHRYENLVDPNTGVCRWRPCPPRRPNVARFHRSPGTSQELCIGRPDLLANHRFDSFSCSRKSLRTTRSHRHPACATPSSSLELARPVEKTTATTATPKIGLKQTRMSLRSTRAG